MANTEPYLIRRLPAKHLDVLDNREVSLENRSKGSPREFYACIYEVDNQMNELFPIYPEWCTDHKQESLFKRARQ